jgi:hypothetical protein
MADNALVTGMALGSSIVGSSVVKEVARDFALRRQGMKPEDNLTLDPIMPTVAEPDLVPQPAEPLARVDERPTDPNRAVTMRRRSSVFGLGSR